MRKLIWIVVCIAFLLCCCNVLAYKPILQKMRNGECELFDMNDVDSITFSHYNIDSVWHEDVVSQVYWINGKPNMTMIADIDSVTFHRPENKIRPGVIEITDNMRENTIGIDYVNGIWTIDSNVSMLKPVSVGDKYFTLEMDSVFPCGFMGEITEIKDDGKVKTIGFNMLDYEDVFESFYGRFSTEIASSSVVVADEETRDRCANSMKKTLDIGFTLKNEIPAFDYRLPLNVQEPKFGFMLDGVLNELGVHFVPTLKVDNEIIVIKGKKVRKSSVVAKIDMTVKTSISGSVSKSIKHPLLSRTVPVAPMVCLFAESGPVIDISFDNVTISNEFTRSFQIESSSVISDISPGVPSLSVDMNNVKWNPDDTFICGSGKLDIGGYFDVGVESLLDAILKQSNEDFDISLGLLGIGFEGGFGIGANAQFTESDWQNSTSNTNLYRALSQPDNISAGMFGKAYAEATLLNISYDITYNLPINPFFQKSFLPRFTDIKLDTSQEHCIKVKAPYKAGLTSPLLALVAYDKNQPTNHNIYNAGKASLSDDVAEGVFEYPQAGQPMCVQPYLQQRQKIILAQPVVEYLDVEDKEPSVEIINYNFHIEKKRLIIPGISEYEDISDTPVLKSDIRIQNLQDYFPVDNDYSYVALVPDGKQYQIVFENETTIIIKDFDWDIQNTKPLYKYDKERNIFSVKLPDVAFNIYALDKDDTQRHIVSLYHYHNEMDVAVAYSSRPYCFLPLTTLSFTPSQKVVDYRVKEKLSGEVTIETYGLLAYYLVGNYVPENPVGLKPQKDGYIYTYIIKDGTRDMIKDDTSDSFESKYNSWVDDKVMPDAVYSHAFLLKYVLLNKYDKVLPCQDVKINYHRVASVNEKDKIVWSDPIYDKIEIVDNFTEAYGCSVE